MFTIILFLCIVSSYCVLGVDHSNGWGSDIDWMKFGDGLKASAEQQKPLMLVIHKTWCGACKALKPKFAEAKAIKDLSSDFVMVNVQDDDEPQDDKFKPDGGYIPRILFLDSEGNVRQEFFNEKGNAQYKFYYPDVNQIATAMMKARTMEPLTATGRDDGEL